MKTQILIAINRNGLKDISLIAQSENECREVMQTYQMYEPEILNFLSAMREKVYRNYSDRKEMKEKDMFDG